MVDNVLVNQEMRLFRQHNSTSLDSERSILSQSKSKSMPKLPRLNVDPCAVQKHASEVGAATQQALQR